MRVTVGLPVLVASIVLIIAAGLVAVAVGTGGAARAGGDRADRAKAATSATHSRATPATIEGLARIETAYRYPLGCLGLTLSPDQGSAVGGQSPCWHYGVYVTAVLGRDNGVWRLMLEATSPKCPAVALPSIIRSALIACNRGAAPSPNG
ncbi:MAG TPA: hypothetical protein VMJ65_08815 [Solirubrobacteraceae bacterium]|nr:hypothetical protein [Solirubrobacteraceae bacterium]